MKRHVELNGARSKKFICPPGNVFNSISSLRPLYLDPWQWMTKMSLTHASLHFRYFFLQTVDIVLFCIAHPTRYLGKRFSLYSQSLRNFFLKKTDNNPDFNTKQKKNHSIYFENPPHVLSEILTFAIFTPSPKTTTKSQAVKKRRTETRLGQRVKLPPWGFWPYIY